MGASAMDSLSPIVRELFHQPEFELMAKQICPLGKQHLDGFQFNFIIQIPGQTVASHIDAPYFWGASRKQFPQWLLAVMVFSGLFEESFIDQVQIVGYLSDINTTDPSTNGEFLYYQSNTAGSGKYESVPARYLAGSAIDGSKVVHASRIYKPATQVPALDKDKDSELVFVGEVGNKERWELLVDGEKMGTYLTSDLRISIVYRARCFANNDEKEAYYKHEAGSMTLEYVLSVLAADLVARERSQGKTQIELLEASPNARLAFALLLMDEYVAYPLPSMDKQPLFPWNYCLVSKKFPWFGELC